MIAAVTITMSPLAKVLLIVHVTMAVIMVGAGYVYPLIMANMKDGGPSRLALARVMKMVSRGFTMPFVLIQPLTGAGLILTTHNLWNPFHSQNRWLFASILIFIVIFLLDTFFAGPAIVRMNKLAEAGDYDGEAFKKDLTALSKVGPIFGILFVIITVLMIWKPGAPNLHY
ncbi:MAG: DUF2269 family protein [Actinomycetota bacterium]|nr:DUF2269 domain-containing protein [Actinomycetota bacterium]